MQAKLHIFGEPFVEISGHRLRIPLRKAEAALFHISLEGRVSRDTLKLLFWGDKNEGQASANLRNALYILRKAMPDNFVSEGRSLCLRGIASDLELADSLENPETPISHVIYEEPLRGLDGVGAPEFDEWLGQARASIRERLVASLKSRIAACYEREMLEELTGSLNALLFFEPFEEYSVLELMEAYAESGHAAKAVSLFNEYSGRVKSELGIRPSSRACEFFAKIAGIASGSLGNQDIPASSAVRTDDEEAFRSGFLPALSALQKEFLSVLSLFEEGAPLYIVAGVLGHSSASLVEAVFELMEFGLVIEKALESESELVFCDAEIKRAFYEAIPNFKKMEFHSRIASELERRYSPQIWDPGLSAAMLHHYGRGGQKANELRQHLREMSFNITLNHILFPLIQDRVLVSCSRPFSDRDETERKIRQIQSLLYELNDSPAIDETEYAGMEARYLEIWGGYLINWGDYRLGRTMIDRSLKISREFGFGETRMYCLEHIGHHYLQTDSSERLCRTGREILAVAHEGGWEAHKGLAIRFVGMSRMQKRDFDSAERIFSRSSQLFEELAITGRNYTLNTLAPICYIGEIKQWSGETRAAEDLFARCIERCRDAELFWGLSHFYAHAADAALDAGDWDLVARHIDEGAALFESSRGGHCGSLLYSLKAIIDAERGDIESAVDSLKKGDFLCTIGKSSWRAAQMMAYAWVSRTQGNKLPGFFRETSKTYAELSAKLYEEIGAPRRAEYVRDAFGIPA